MLFSHFCTFTCSVQSFHLVGPTIIGNSKSKKKERRNWKFSPCCPWNLLKCRFSFPITHLLDAITSRSSLTSNFFPYLSYNPGLFCLYYHYFPFCKNNWYFSCIGKATIHVLFVTSFFWACEQCRAISRSRNIVNCGSKWSQGHYHVGKPNGTCVRSYTSIHLNCKRPNLIHIRTVITIALIFLSCWFESLYLHHLESFRSEI